MKRTKRLLLHDNNHNHNNNNNNKKIILLFVYSLFASHLCSLSNATKTKNIHEKQQKQYEKNENNNKIKLLRGDQENTNKEESFFVTTRDLQTCSNIRCQDNGACRSSGCGNCGFNSKCEVDTSFVDNNDRFANGGGCERISCNTNPICYGNGCGGGCINGYCVAGGGQQFNNRNTFCNNSGNRVACCQNIYIPNGVANWNQYCNNRGCYGGYNNGRCRAGGNYYNNNRFNNNNYCNDQVQCCRNVFVGNMHNTNRNRNQYCRNRGCHGGFYNGRCQPSGGINGNRNFNNNNNRYCNGNPQCCGSLDPSLATFPDRFCRDRGCWGGHYNGWCHAN